MAANNCLLTNDTRSNVLETILTTQVKKSACFVVLRIFSGPRFGLPVPRLDAFYLMKVISHARLKAHPIDCSAKTNIQDIPSGQLNT